MRSVHLFTVLCLTFLSVLSRGVRAQESPPENTISGRITDQGGQPMAGLLVQAVPYDPLVAQLETIYGRVGEPDDRPVEQLAKGYARRLEQARTGTCETRTNDAGRYCFTNLGRSPFYRVTPYGKSLRFQRPAVQPGDTRDFVAEAVMPIELDILMDDGTVPEYGVGVNWKLDSTAGGSSYDIWSAERKRIWIKQGKGFLRALYGAGRAWASQPVALDTTHLPDEPLRLVLAKRPRLDVRLAVAEGPKQNWTGTILVLPLEAGRDTPSEEQLKAPGGLLERRRRERERERAVNPRTQYTATWLDLEPGRYFIGYTQKSRRSKADDFIATRVVNYGGGVASASLAPDLERLGPHVDLIITGPGGFSLSEPTFFASAHRGPHSQRSVATQVQARDGQTWRVRIMDRTPREHKTVFGAHFPQANVPEVFRISVSFPDLGRRVVEWDGLGPGPTTVAFKPPARVHVQIRNYSTHRLKGHVGLKLIEDMGRKPLLGFYANWNPVLPNEDGETEMKPVQPGNYQVCTMVEGEPGRFATQEAVPIKLRSGAAKAEVSLPELFDVEVSVPGRNGDIYVLQKPHEHATSFDERTVPLANGRLVFKRVRPASYIITGQGLEHPVEVTSDLRITIPPP